MPDFTKEQEGYGRLAEMLRELAPHITDIGLGELPGGISMIWPASNIRERLHDAADLIETLIIARHAPTDSATR